MFEFSSNSDKRSLPILMYHRCPNDLRRQLQYIKDELGLIPAHLTDDEVLSYLVGRAGAFPGRKIVLTFDDAYLDFYGENGVSSLLANLDCKATVCVPTGDIADHEDDRQSPEWTTPSRSPLMVWPELRQLRQLKAKDGQELLEFIPHSVSHSSFDDTQTNVRAEVKESKAALGERLQIRTSRIVFFCLPGGTGEGKPDIQQVLWGEGYVGALRAHAKKGHGWCRYSIPRCQPQDEHHLRQLLGEPYGFECD